MFAVPVETPVITPVDEPIEATAELLLLHTPPGVALVNIALLPAHTDEEPLIAAGAAGTVFTVKMRTTLVKPHASVTV